MRLLILSFFILMLAACSNAQPIDEPEPETAEEETDQENSAENDEVSESEEKPEEPELEPAYDSTGNVDVLSPDFHKDYLNNYYYNSYSGIERGMTKNEVAATLGEPSDEDDVPVDEVFNDIGVRYSSPSDTVEQILVTPEEDISLDKVIESFGEPTQDLSPEDTGTNVRILTYQPAEDANFYIVVEGDEDDNVSLIYPSYTSNAAVVNEDNVLDFISAYYDKNVIDMSLINFEDPVLNETEGYFEVPFVNIHHGLTGHFRVWLYGQVEYINENGEYAYGEFIPYANGEIK
ncbi:hypothetical protein GCM10007275_18760 [Jeotgalicoccus coquinae]|uniref:Uncharacterized protein n=1 Tax=Jeotgalicoccus coquinae TaxID=709509 RepID=A0A6V7RR20_9STAP|nr:hypothetical protein [Jeotgalicoccus coquinae]MBB6423923.1 hypothetical protein [Jeotgalicoccus coquinae]GGE23919.1 hypothetical protein GCM10007275_18760 [Jeotgalicoccus coquinae]CAD2080434.1 hypothetical protein JEOCOQ751_01743 [Jeotgalicoccus coquinae]